MARRFPEGVYGHLRGPWELLAPKCETRRALGCGCRRETPWKQTEFPNGPAISQGIHSVPNANQGEHSGQGAEGKTQGVR
jgi:hypothetical protein